MTAAFGKATATELSRPDFCAVAQAFSIPAYRATPDNLSEVLRRSWTANGPNVVVLQARLSMFAPTYEVTDPARNKH